MEHTRTIKEVLQDSYREDIRALKAKNPKIVSYDQSSSVRCPIHGRHGVSYFVASGVPAQYVCGICWKEN